MNKIYTKQVQFDFDGNCIITVPEKICEYLNIQPGDVVVWELVEDKVIIRKRQEL